MKGTVLLAEFTFMHLHTLVFTLSVCGSKVSSTIENALVALSTATLLRQNSDSIGGASSLHFFPLQAAEVFEASGRPQAVF